jgi:glycogen debranching enzyme
MTRILLSAALGLLLATAAAGDPDADALARLGLTVTAEHPREFIHTDKGAAHLCGEAVGANTRSYHGFFVAMYELMDGWSLRLEDGTLLDAATAASATVYPDRLVRRWTLPDGAEATAEISVFDRADALRIVYRGLPAGAFAFTPRVDMRFLWKVVRPDYAVEWSTGALRVARRDRLTDDDGRRDPPWLAVLPVGATEFEPGGRYLDRRYPKGAARTAMERATPWEPGELRGRIPAQVDAGRFEVVVAAGATSDAAAARAQDLLADADRQLAARSQRLAAVARGGAASPVDGTGSARDDAALAWARISLDDLVMAQRGPGVYAGFYWFTTYWGRDTFIVLPGALAGGLDYATARAILRSFATYQDRNPRSVRFGRVPNFVTVEQVQYASIDGTWWFVRALDEYWKRSGDMDFAREMMPVVFRACEGALTHAVDADGLLTHGDGETWMDGGGEAHPYSPRGDRAVESQALFHRGLEVAARLAERFDGTAAGLSGQALADRYRVAAARLRTSFQARFALDGRIADHLNRDGSPDAQHRPNGLLALLVSPDLFEPAQRAWIVAENREHTVTPWGVRSLDAADPDYHPRHLWLDRYYYDEAYHNGDVWLWLSGPWVSAQADPRDAFGQTRMLLDEILDEGAVGTLQEIRDGDRAASNDEFGGATSQAWSLSELLRTVADDYLGVRCDLSGEAPSILVEPAVPAEWPLLRWSVRVGDSRLFVEAAGERVKSWRLEGPDADVLRPRVRIRD